MADSKKEKVAFNVFFLVNSMWIADIDNPYLGERISRKSLSDIVRQLHPGRIYKIRKVG